MKFSGNVGNGANEQTIKFRWRYGLRLDTGLVFRICHYWEVRKVVNNGYSFILIRQMAALVRRALAEVCTVPVLLFRHVMQANTDSGKKLP